MKYVNRSLLCIALFLFANIEVKAQSLKFKGEISFKVAAPAKEITALSNEFVLLINPDKGTVALDVPVSSFQFGTNFFSDTLNGRLKDRFNNYYMQSNLFPAISFNCMISKFSLGKDTTHKMKGEGVLTVRGIKKHIQFELEMTVHHKQVKVHATATFVPAYFNIPIPAYINDFYFKTVDIELEAFSH